MRKILFRIISGVLYLLIPHFINAQSTDSLGVMYAGIDNPVKVEVSGIPISELSVTAQGGTIIKTADGWLVRPTNAIGETVELIAGTKDRTLFVKSYEIKRLPGPSVYIAYEDTTGSPRRYRGGTPISKEILLNADGIGADYGIENFYECRVLSFSIQLQNSMGNLITEFSTSNKFTDRQKEMIRRLRKGDSFWITNTQALCSPRRTLPSIEVIID